MATNHRTHVELQTAAHNFRTQAELLLSPKTWTAHLAGECHSAIRARFSKEKEIRGFIEGSRNLGHQSATLELVQSLVVLTGFAGRIVLYYADYGIDPHYSTESKIKVLLGLPPTTELATYTWKIGEAKVSFRTYNERGQITTSVTFGISGGADDLGNDLARELNVHWFLRIQPFMWEGSEADKGHPFFQCSRIDGTNGRNFYLNDECPEFANLPLPVVDIRTSVDRSPCGQRPCERGGTGSALTWPIHFLHNFEPHAPELILKIVLIAQLAADANSRRVHVRSFGPAPEDDERLCYVRLLDPADSPPDLRLRRLYRALRHRTGLPADRCHCLASFAIRTCAGGVTVTGAADVTNSSGLELDNAAPVIYEQVGPVDRDSFLYTLLHAGLPPVAEGQNTVNELLRSARPYLQLFRRRRMIHAGYLCPDWSKSAGVAVPLLEDLSAFVSQPFGSENERRSDNEKVEQDTIEHEFKVAVRTLTQCQDSESDLARYFRELADYFSYFGRNKLEMGLLALESVLTCGR